MIVLPMICNSCTHLNANWTCDAFPQGIMLDFQQAEMHDEPVEGQEGDTVFELDPAHQADYNDFLEFRSSLINMVGELKPDRDRVKAEREGMFDTDTTFDQEDLDRADDVLIE